MTLSSRGLRRKIAQKLALMRGVLLRRTRGLSIGPRTRVSWSTRIDRGDWGCLRIGAYSELSHGVALLTYDPATGHHADIVIGDCTFIGAHTIVYPGTHIGDHCIIGPGSVVMNDIPSHSTAAGNPARIIRGNVKTGKYGILEVVGARDDDRPM